MKIKTVSIQSCKLNAAIAAFGPGTTEIGISFCCAKVNSGQGRLYTVFQHQKQERYSNLVQVYL